MIRSFARSDFAAMLAVLGFVFALLLSKWAGAQEQPHPKCSVVYINGDAVISCKRDAQ